MKRLKKILRGIELALVAGVAMVLMVNAWLVWTSTARLDYQLAAIHRAGDPTTLADLEPSPIPAAQNAATYLRQANAEISAIYKAMGKVPGALPPSDSVCGSNAAAAAGAVTRILQAHAKVVPLLTQAAACRDNNLELDYTLPPGESIAQSIKVAERYGAYVGVLLYGRAMPLLAEGRRDEAVRTMVQALQLARQADHNPLLIGYLAMLRVRGWATDCIDVALQTGPVSKPVRRALEAELAIQDRMQAYVWVLRSQRAAFLDEFKTIPHRQDWFISRVMWNRQESACLETLAFDLAIAQDPRPYRDTAQLIAERPKTAWGVGGGMLPSIRVSQRLVALLRAKVRVLRVLNAIQENPPAAGQPPQLSELGLPAEAYTDPFTGEPLHVKRIMGGWLIYSVGENYRDDGGSSKAPRDDVHAGELPPAAGGVETTRRQSLAKPG